MEQIFDPPLGWADYAGLKEDRIGILSALAGGGFLLNCSDALIAISHHYMKQIGPDLAPLDNNPQDDKAQGLWRERKQPAGITLTRTG